MALVGPHSGGQSVCPSFLARNKSNHVFSPNPILSISKNTKKIPRSYVSASAVSSGSAAVVGSPPPGEVVKTADSHGKDANISGKIDSWMQESVVDIVSNLKQSPLLVKIQSENDGRVKIQTEKAIARDWPVLKSEWRRGESRSPDGLIFVEELEKNPDQDQDFGEGVTRAWGIVVQEKGVECGPTCYLLKTNRVCGGMGLGFCTHFCLMKVNSFRDSALKQFNDSWLLQ
ncbi:UNVERIFIED_CONTAM: hypothetical protein Sangu_2115000 [Sesamum angustifolium]|uniref:DUF7804 domain-containing protein n=1 Tax=Sesamum angustifolium TaxID=2727405 RepID=A0AAW2LEH3_9LAMI